MSTEDVLDNAIRAYIAERYPDATVSDWSAVVAVVDLEDPDQATTYVLAAPERQSPHASYGLLTLGAVLIQEGDE
jgi:hypothetical protein